MPPYPPTPRSLTTITFMAHNIYSVTSTLQHLDLNYLSLTLKLNVAPTFLQATAVTEVVCVLAKGSFKACSH